MDIWVPEINNKLGLTKGSVVISYYNRDPVQATSIKENIVNKLINSTSSNNRFVPDGFDMDNNIISNAAINSGDRNPYSGIKAITDNQKKIILDLFQLIVGENLQSVLNYSSTGSGKTIHLLTICCLLRNYNGFDYLSEDVVKSGIGNDSVFIVGPASALVNWSYAISTISNLVSVFNKFREEQLSQNGYFYNGVYIPMAIIPSAVYTASCTSLETENTSKGINPRYATDQFSGSSFQILRPTIHAEFPVVVSRGTAKYTIITPTCSEYESEQEAYNTWIEGKSIVAQNEEAIRNYVYDNGLDRDRYAIAVGYSIHAYRTLCYMINKGLTVIVDESHKGKNADTTVTSCLSAIAATVIHSRGGNISFKLPYYYYLSVRKRSVKKYDHIYFYPVYNNYARSCILSCTATITDKENRNGIAGSIGGYGPKIATYSNSSVNIFSFATFLYKAMELMLCVIEDGGRMYSPIAEKYMNPEYIPDFYKSLHILKNVEIIGGQTTSDVNRNCAVIVDGYIQIAGRAIDFVGVDEIDNNRTITRTISVLPLAASNLDEEQRMSKYAAEYHNEIKEEGRESRYTNGGQNLEPMLADKMIDESVKILKSDQKARIIMFFRYTDTIKRVTESFSYIAKHKRSMAEYSEINNLDEVLMINGSISQQNKLILASIFNTNINFRVMIVQIDSGSESLSYHDQIGIASNTYMFMVYSNIRLTFDQAIGRIYRTGAKSDSIVYVVVPSIKYSITTKHDEYLVNSLVNYYDQNVLNDLYNHYLMNNPMYTMDQFKCELMDHWIDRILYAQTKYYMQYKDDAVYNEDYRYNYVSFLYENGVAQYVYDYILAHPWSTDPQDRYVYAAMVELIVDSALYSCANRNVSLQDLIKLSNERGRNLQATMINRKIEQLEHNCAGYGLMTT